MKLYNVLMAEAEPEQMELPFDPPLKIDEEEEEDDDDDVDEDDVDEDDEEDEKE
jgi:hypothetical protein